MQLQFATGLSVNLLEYNVSVLKILQTLLSTLLKRTNGVMPSGGFEKPSAISMSFSRDASVFACSHDSDT